jgi:hypothetical protein
MAKKIRPDEERFWEKVDIKGLDDCWEWKAGRFPEGYGQFYFDDTSKYAHRVAWKFIYGDIPPGIKVLHHCDNPPCCNPIHLFLGTHTDNMRDKLNKHRENMPKGEKHGMAKLTEKDVKKIRELYQTGNYLQREIADIFNVSQALVSAIFFRRVWKHLK